MSLDADETLYAERAEWYRSAGINQLPTREPQVLHAITLWQPWASAMAKGLKTFETRSWPCRLEAGTLLAIHAAKSIPPALRQWITRDQDPGAQALRQILRRHALMLDTLPYGAVVAVVRFQECLSTGCTDFRMMTPEWVGQLPWEEYNLGDFSQGRYAWRCELVKAFDAPIPARGAQQIWRWTAPAGALEGVKL